MVACISDPFPRPASRAASGRPGVHTGATMFTASGPLPRRPWLVRYHPYPAATMPGRVPGPAYTSPPAFATGNLVASRVETPWPGRRLLDDLGSLQQHGLWDGEPEGLGRLEVDHEVGRH